MRLSVDGQEYRALVRRRVTEGPEAPRLVIVSYLPNRTARRVLDVAVRAIRKFTSGPYELWIVDNNSPLRHALPLLAIGGANVVLNRTEPVPAADPGDGRQLSHGSYANAVALELAARLVPADTRWFMPLHMDVAPCADGWLEFLVAKLDGRVGAAGVRLDRARTPEGVLHVLGYVVDFQLFRRLGLDFLPDLPHHDVGDRVTIALRDAGHDVYACRNTLWEPELVETIPSSSPLRSLGVDRSFDDDGRVVFLHLGRGVRKSAAGAQTGVGADEWVDFARRHLA